DRSVVPKLAEALKARGNDVQILYSGSDLKGADRAIVLGGDGALLHTAVTAAKQNAEVMGINYGTLGFLCEFEAKETMQAVELICGEHEILPRTMLKITVDDKEFYALNETVLQRDYARPYGNQVAEIGVLLNGHKTYDYVADGIVVATPTGSTAYSLSAGGSILTPDVKAFIVTPICALSLFARPTVISDENKVSFDLSNQKDKMNLFADGKPIASVTKESHILIEKAPFTANFITGNKNRLFATLYKKLLR
ncbi:MAG: NAD(+)/NADH kinase, partial [Clostridia bacterium]|nr:NAD(+)/NADH kinase [Clostridia bacterium]